MADDPTRYLPDDAPQQCTQEGCRRDHVAEVEYATNHMGQALPWPHAVLGLGGEYVQVVRPGQQCIVWDPCEDATITLRRDFAGILIVDDGVARQLEDDRPDTLNDLNPIVRAVLIARLRAWADQLGDAIEVRTLGGERVV